MTNKTHYEQAIGVYGTEREFASGLLDEAVENGYPYVAAVAFLAKNLEQVLARKFQRRAKKIKDLGNGEHLVEVNLRDPDVMAAGLQILMSTIDRVMERMLAEQDDPYSYFTLLDNDEFQKFGGFVSESLLQGSFVTQAIILYHILSHERAGRRVYSPSVALGEQLTHTELRGLQTEDLRLPFENIYIEVPISVDLKVYNEETGWHRCVGIYVTEDSAGSFLSGAVSPGSDPYVGRRQHGRCWRIMAVGESKGIITYDHGLSEVDDALSYFRIPLEEGKTLDEAVCRADQDMKKTREMNQDHGWVNMDEEWKRMFAWLMNVVLYATWTEPGEHWFANKEARQLWERAKKAPKGKRRAKLNKRFQNLKDKMPRIVLGRSVTIDRTTLQLDSENGKGSPHMVRTRVAGHWRNQAHGKGHKLRKIIRIAPFWKGPEDAPISTPNHRLK